MSILNVDTLQNRAGVSTAVSLANLYGGVAAAWGVFSTNNTAANCIRESFNIITLIDEGTGLFRVVFERSLGIKGNGYVFLGSSANGATDSANTTTQNRYCQQDGTFTPGDFRALIHRASPNAGMDDNYVTMMFFAKT